MQGNSEKGLLTILISLIVIYGNWFQALVVVYFICCSLDFISGTASAIKTKSWSANSAWNGVWKKSGSMFAILVAAITDMLLHMLANGLQVGIDIPEFDLLFCPLVISWYIVTELGSVIENAHTLGAPIPKFLYHAIEKLNASIDDEE